MFQGALVLGLLILAILFSRNTYHPRDLIFAIAGLMTSLFGIVPSPQISQALFNPFTWIILGWWVLKKLQRRPTLFPLPLLLDIFSAYLFYFAMQNSGLAALLEPFFITWPTFLLCVLFFLFAQMLARWTAFPLSFALLFSIIPHSPILLGISIALGASFSRLHMKFHRHFYRAGL